MLISKCSHACQKMTLVKAPTAQDNLAIPWTLKFREYSDNV
jgi:hypothetical protein